MEDEITDTEMLTAHAWKRVEHARGYLDQQQQGRETALEYLNGLMKDLALPDGSTNRSQVVSMDLRAMVKKLMPSIMRTILGGGDLVKFEPVGPEDEDGAEQATEYVNHVIIKEADVEDALYDAIYDALVLKTGILKWSAYRCRKVFIQRYTDAPTEQVLGLFDDPLNEITEYEESEETDQQVLALMPDARRHSFKLKRVETKITPKITAVERGSFLITPGAKSIEAAELVGEIILKMRSELVEEGYDKDAVWSLAAHDERAEDEHSRMGDDYYDGRGETTKAAEIVEVFEVYIRLDMDQDGISELYRLVFGEGSDSAGNATGNSHVVLGLEEVDEAPYADVIAERDPHQFEGHSVYEDARMIQRVKTALLRGVLDNIYEQNEPKAIVNFNAVRNPAAVMAGGAPIQLKDGFRPEDVINWRTIPFFGDKALEMLAYMDEMGRDHSGIADNSSGLPADKLHNIAATTALLATEPAIAQADMIVRSLANKGIRRAFRGLLRLVISHADGPRTVRIDGEWKPYDPRVWNMDMDCTVNTGLGGGTKERDMAVLQVIIGLQQQILAALGPDNPLVKPDQLYNTLEKITETAGFKNPSAFFTKPDPAEVQARLEAMRNAPDPEIEKVKVQGQVQAEIEKMKLQFQAQTEQQKLQIDAERERMKAEVQRDKERAQMEADMIVRREEAANDAALQSQKLLMDVAQKNRDRDLEREKMQQEWKIKLLELGARDGEDGPVSKEDDRHSTMLSSLEKMIGSLAEAQSKPKRVLRDENGDVIGVETIN